VPATATTTLLLSCRVTGTLSSTSHLKLSTSSLFVPVTKFNTEMVSQIGFLWDIISVFVCHCCLNIH